MPTVNKQQNMFSQFAQQGGEALAKIIWDSIEEVIPAIPRDLRMDIIRSVLRRATILSSKHVANAAENAIFKALGVDLRGIVDSIRSKL